MNVHTLPEAGDELQDAADYYEQRSPGLGSRFLDDLGRTMERITAHPEAWRRVSALERRCLLNDFPYGIVYRVEGEDILVWVEDNAGLYRPEHTGSGLGMSLVDRRIGRKIRSDKSIPRQQLDSLQPMPRQSLAHPRFPSSSRIGQPFL